jgi:hypothetical protein
VSLVTYPDKSTSAAIVPISSHSYFLLIGLSTQMNSENKLPADEDVCTIYIVFCTFSDGSGNLVTILYNSKPIVAEITPVSEILIPAPAVSLSCLFSKSELILATTPFKVFKVEAFVPTKFKVVRNTLSKVVISKVFNSLIFVVLTTTASDKVIGTNSLLF